jgi:Sigma-70 region 2
MNMIATAPVLGERPSLISFVDESERLLIRRAQGGDGAARDELQRRYHSWRIKRCHEFSRQNKLPKRRADDKRLPDLDWNDLVATAWLAFSDAIDRFDPTKNNGLEAYARIWVDGALRRLGRGQYDLGIVDEGRAGRWLRSRWHEDIEPEDVVEAVGGNLLDAQRAIWAEGARRGGGALHRVSYDTVTEGGYDIGALATDEDGGASEAYVADHSPIVGAAYKPRNDADWEHYCQRRETAKAQDRPGPKAESFPAPLKLVSRSQYESDQCTAHRLARVSPKDHKEILLRIWVGERILYPIIGGWRPPRWSGEELKPRQKKRARKLERDADGWHVKAAGVLPDLTQTNVVPFPESSARGVRPSLVQTNRRLFAEFGARWHPRFKKFKRGYSETSQVRFKSGAVRAVVHQRGGPVRQIELTAEICAAALDSRALAATRDEWRGWLRGKRPNPDSKNRPVFDRCPIERCTLPDEDQTESGDETRS